MSLIQKVGVQNIFLNFITKQIPVIFFFKIQINDL